jgi:hypothetical protein
VGYAGNVRPDYVFPTAIAAADEGASEIGGSARDGLKDLDFCLGDLALASTRHSANYPVKHGLIENWTNMERVWQRCFFEHMRCDPEESYVVLVRVRAPSPPSPPHTFSPSILFARECELLMPLPLAPSPPHTHAISHGLFADRAPPQPP